MLIIGGIIRVIVFSVVSVLRSIAVPTNNQDGECPLHKRLIYEAVWELIDPLPF